MGKQLKNTMFPYNLMGLCLIYLTSRRGANVLDNGSLRLTGASCVSAQPLKFGDDLVNLRKLSELPYQLLHAGRIDELKQEVLGNMEWIVCKIQVTGMKSMLEDFSACTKQVDCPEVQLIQDALLLIWPTVDFMENGIDPSVLCIEMLARLDFFKGSYPMIDELCKQCEKWCAVWPNPIFTPLCGFFQPPGGPLRTTLTGFSK
ncbi:hypothetical protein scyTo_0021003, partial [Scyliorhinus torazame]|nr:hypothetical protein [Scyliorhinus torazame]